MAVKILVLAVLVALAAAQAPYPYKPVGIPPVDAYLKDYPVDPIAVAAKAAELRGIAPVAPSVYGANYNPYLYKSGLYPYASEEYPYGANSYSGYSGYYNYPGIPKY